MRFIWTFCLVSMLATSAYAEVVDSDFGSVIPVRLEANKARQIMFSLPLDSIEVREDTGLDVRVVKESKDMIVMDSALLLAPQDVFVTDIEGNRFHLRVEMVEDIQDAMLFVKTRRAEESKFAKIVRETPLTDLLAAMAADRRIDGYGLVEFKKPKQIYWRDGLSIYIHRKYTSGQWTGIVAMVVNSNKFPAAFEVQSFDYPGLVAIGSVSSILAAAPRTASEVRAGKYKTRLELVVDSSSDPKQLAPIQ